MATQCEGCLGYYDEGVMDVAILCDECQDKAAKYDITASERETLGKAIQEVLPLLDKLTPSYEVGVIIGKLRATLNSCRFDVESKAEHKES